MKKYIFLLPIVLITYFNSYTVIVKNNSFLVIEIHERFNENSEKYEPIILYPQETCKLKSDYISIQIHGYDFNKSYPNLKEDTIIHFNKQRTQIE